MYMYKQYYLQIQVKSSFVQCLQWFIIAFQMGGLSRESPRDALRQINWFSAIESMARRHSNHRQTQFLNNKSWENE